MGINRKDVWNNATYTKLISGDLVTTERHVHGLLGHGGAGTAKSTRKHL
jgi:hypothetical protein